MHHVVEGAARYGGVIGGVRTGAQHRGAGHGDADQVARESDPRDLGRGPGGAGVGEVDGGLGQIVGVGGGRVECGGQDGRRELPVPVQLSGVGVVLVVAVGREDAGLVVPSGAVHRHAAQARAHVFVPPVGYSGAGGGYAGRVVDGAVGRPVHQAQGHVDVRGPVQGGNGCAVGICHADVGVLAVAVPQDPIPEGVGLAAVAEGAGRDRVEPGCRSADGQVRDIHAIDA